MMMKIGKNSKNTLVYECAYNNFFLGIDRYDNFFEMDTI